MWLSCQRVTRHKMDVQTSVQLTLRTYVIHDSVLLQEILCS